MNGRPLIEGIEMCVDIAERKRPEDLTLHAGNDDLIRSLRIETFIAAMAGVLQRDDMALSNRVFALLAAPKKEVS